MKLYVARDEDETLCLYFGNKPTRCPSKFEGRGMWFSADSGCSPIPNELFPEVKWEDEEPLEVKLVPKNDLSKAFVAGATWWEHQKTGCTIWPSDRNLAEQESIERYKEKTEETENL